jgi:flagellar basal-body rod protein FlgB
LLHRSLGVESLRREVYANNHANAEVPNFKRTEVNFESALKQALDSEERRPLLELTRTDDRHISNYAPLDYRDVRPRRVLDYLSQTKANGNNVDAEHEFNLIVQNQMRYTLYVQSLTHEFAQVSSVLRP